MELRRQYHGQLDDIYRSLGEMIGLVLSGTDLATMAVLDASPESLTQLAQHELTIDGLCRQVEDGAVHAIRCQAPAGSDLRLLLAAVRMAPELERTHDLLGHIAARGVALHAGPLSPATAATIRRMGSLAHTMWGEVASVFDAHGPCPGDLLRDLDVGMDEMRSHLVHEVASTVASIQAAMELGLMARFYERVGDHAVTTGRRVGTLTGLRTARG